MTVGKSLSYGRRAGALRRGRHLWFLHGGPEDSGQRWPQRALALVPGELAVGILLVITLSATRLIRKCLESGSSGLEPLLGAQEVGLSVPAPLHEPINDPSTVSCVLPSGLTFGTLLYLASDFALTRTGLGGGGPVPFTGEERATEMFSAVAKALSGPDAGLPASGPSGPTCRSRLAE